MEQYKYNCIHGGGEYHGYVFAEGGQTVFEAHYPQFHYDEELGEKVEELTLFDLGIMKNTLDVIGLQNHLRNLNLIGPDAVIVMDSEKADKGAVIESITGGVHSAVNPVVGYADGGEVEYEVTGSGLGEPYKVKAKSKEEAIQKAIDALKPVFGTLKKSGFSAKKMADGGETTQQSGDELMEKIRAILKEELPNFYTFVKKGKNAISGDEYLVILMAASNYEINRVRGQYPQAVSLMLNLKDMDLHPQVFGGNGGQSIYLIPDKNDPKEKYLAMASRKVPFRRPKPNEKAVLEAIRKFAINYRNLLKENKDRLKYGSSEPEFQRYVDYDNLLDYYADGGSTKGYNPAQEVIDSIYGSAGTVYRVAADLGDGNVGLTPWYSKAVIDDVIKDIADSGYKILNVEQKEEDYAYGGPTDWKIDLFKEGGKSKKSFKEMTFKEKSASIQAKLRGRKVSPKYRKKYGKTYDSKEAKEAADAITGKIVSKMKE